MTKLAIVCTVLLGACSLLGAQDFDPRRYFGDCYTPAELPQEGTLKLSLSQGKLPPWTSLGGSGTSRVNDRFSGSSEGTAFNTDSDHRTLQLGLDLAAELLEVQVEVRSLKAGGAFAFLLTDYADGNRAWLVELKNSDGRLQLLIRARTRERFATLPDATTTLPDNSLPLTLKLAFRNGALSGQVGKAVVTAETKFQGGLTLALTATDAPAVVRNLQVYFASHGQWRADAQERQNAQDILSRLREYADEGLLAGVGSRAHPALAANLAALPQADRDARELALEQPFASRAGALTVLADAHPGLAAISHEAGLAALLAGLPDTARRLLVQARKTDSAPETLLLLAEAQRRLGQVDAAAASLEQAQKGLPEALLADAALLRARLAAARGDLPAALETLTAATAAYPQHQQLAAFLDSAQALNDLPRLSVDAELAPFGLRLVGTIRPEVLARVLQRVKPYTAQIRNWLPDMPKQAKGTIALFDNSVDYLRAALLVAGDNLDNVAGMYIPRGVNNQPAVLASRAFGEDELLRTLVHELWHLAVDACGLGAKMPRWLNEGMAVYLSAARHVGERLVYDTLPSEFVEFADTMAAGLGNETIADVLKLGAHEFYRPEHVRRNYAAAWAYVLACANSDDIRTLVRAVGGDAKEMIELAKLPGMPAAANELLKKLARAG